MLELPYDVSEAVAVQGVSAWPGKILLIHGKRKEGVPLEQQSLTCVQGLWVICTLHGTCKG